MSNDEHAVIMTILTEIRNDVAETKSGVLAQNGRVRTCEKQLAALSLAVYGVGSVGWASLVALLLRHMGLL